MPKKIIINTDIGDDIDDSIAILLALLDDEIDVLGITTVFRNTDKRARIVVELLKTLGRNIPVYAGEGTPLDNKILISDFDKVDSNGEVIMSHYFDYMEGNYYDKSVSAVDFIIDIVKKNPYEVTFVELGPMTNLARVLEKDREAYEQIKEIYFMGGQPETCFKEWNVRCDIESAHKVLSTNIPMKMFGLNVSKKCGLKISQADEILNIKNQPYSRLLKEMMLGYINYFDGKRMPIMHDPLVLLSLNNDYCQFKKVRVEVINSGDDRGRTVIVDDSIIKNIEMAINVDESKVIDNILKTLKEGKI